MKIKIKIASLILLGLFTVQAEALVVTSLNIQWFGRGGDMYGSIEDEHRHVRLKEYITKVLPASDVYVFQEIVDKEGLYQIMEGFECISYDAGGSHQFVVMCSKKGLLQNHDVNHDVRLNRWGLRAALIGDYKIKDKTVRLIGVHLKAGWKDSPVRIDQIEALKTSLDEDLSTVIIGDFNTYKKDRTNLVFDDAELIGESLGEKFSLVKNKIPTYMGYGGRVFDRAWTKNLKVVKAEVLGPCKEGSVTVPFAEKSFYKRFVSDHCALSIKAD